MIGDDQIRQLLAELHGTTEFERKKLDVETFFGQCGGSRAAVQRLSIPLAAARNRKIGAGWWALVESGGSANVDLSYTSRDSESAEKRTPLVTGELVVGPWHEAYINIPSGEVGTLVLRIARLPVIPPNWLYSILRLGDAVVSAANPLPVTAVVTGTPAVNVAQIGGTAQTGVDVSSKYARRIMTDIAPTSVTVGAASASAVAARALRAMLYLRDTHASQRISLAWGTQVAVLDSGMTMKSDDWLAWDALDGISEEAVIAIAAGAGTTMAVQEAL